MLRHILKLVWKRKSRNALLSLEILIAFVLVFAVSAFAVRYAQLYRLPLGFDYASVWYVDISTGAERSQSKTEHGLALAALVREVKALPQVEGAGLAAFAPFANSRWRTEYGLADGSAVQPVSLYNMSAGTPETLGIQLVEGRWFSEQDGPDEKLVVINRKLARTWFPGGSAVGQRVSERDGDHTPVFARVVGVVEDLRPQGEFTAPTNTIVERYVPGHTETNPRTLLLHVRPGTARSFEGALAARLQQLQPGWAFEIRPLAEQRISHLREQLVPLAVLGVIGVFLLLMVGFGLFGVLWQNTTLRIPEIGLRRAIGASPGRIYRQIVTEQLVLSTFAVAVGLVLLVQLPVTGVLGESLDWTVFGGAALLSAAVIYLLSLVCALYPGWRASGLSPTEALHYE